MKVKTHIRGKQPRLFKKSGRDGIEKGYEQRKTRYRLLRAKVSYTLALKPQNSNMEYEIYLANVFLTKK